MAKVLSITKSAWCYHREKGILYGSVECYHPDSARGRCHRDVIPEWCPLEDAPEPHEAKEVQHA